MPEGDLLFRAARTYQRALAGRTITGFRSELAQPRSVAREARLEGRTVERVESLGKHLLVRISGGLVLRLHLRMNGALHIYRPGERWQRAPARARIVLETEDFVLVAFDLQEAELLREDALARHGALSRLGPDILGEALDAAEVVRRMRARGRRSIAEVLLDQRVIAGIGNIWKSESLFEARVNPFKAAGELSDDELRRVIDAARRLMRAAVSEKGSRPRLRVYERMGAPCRSCGGAIRMLRQGLDIRSTYFCPSCQHVELDPRANGGSDALGAPRE